MKVYSLYLGEEEEHRSYAAFHRWAESKLLFASKNGLKQFGGQTATLSFKQVGDGELLTVALDKKKIERKPDTKMNDDELARHYARRDFESFDLRYFQEDDEDDPLEEELL